MWTGFSWLRKGTTAGLAISWPAEGRLASQEGHYPMVLINSLTAHVQKDICTRMITFKRLVYKFWTYYAIYLLIVMTLYSLEGKEDLFSEWKAWEVIKVLISFKLNNARVKLLIQNLNIRKIIRNKFTSILQHTPAKIRKFFQNL